MESFTHESEESSSCTQSDGDSTNSSNGTNPFLLCPRANSSLHLQLGGHGRTHDITEDTRPFKLARMEPPPPHHHQFHTSAIASPQGANSLRYPRNIVGAIHGSDGLHSSTFLSQSRSYASSGLEDCRGPSAQAAPAARSHHGSLPYLGPPQSYFTPDQWAELRQQTYVLKHVAAGNTPPSALLLPMGCKVENVPINFGSNPGSFFLGLADSQPGRCRRTDGKKWRCGRAVVPNQKYCERHMHRGRGRSKAARLAKLNATVDATEPLSSTQPLNQPLIQLLNQLAVPIQPLNNHPDPVQQPPIPAQPLKWLGNPAQPFLHPHTHLPYLAQPLHAEPLSQLPIPSKSLDWSLNQLPMQAEPLDRIHVYGEPPILAQAIPMSSIPEIKDRSNPSNGPVIKEASRAHAEDHEDVFTLDVPGIKRLLENAPCSMRARNLVGQPKQLPNVADLLNVAHVRSSASQSKQKPSLMDILKMVDPGAAPTSTTSVINHQMQLSAKNNGTVPANCHQNTGASPARGCAGAPVSLALSDAQPVEEQSRKYSSATAIMSGSLKFLAGWPKEDTTSRNFFKVKCEEDEERVERNVSRDGVDLSKHMEGRHLLSTTRVDSHKIQGPLTVLAEGCENYNTSSNTASGGQAELAVLVKESQDCFRSSTMSEKASSDLFEKRRKNSAELNKNIRSSLQSSVNCCKLSPRLDVNSSDSAEGGCDHHISLIKQDRNSPGLREEGLKYCERSSTSERDSLTLPEGCMVHCETHVNPGNSSAEKSLEQHEGSASLDTSHPTSVKKCLDHHEISVVLDMNSSILAAENLGNAGSSHELEKESTSLSPPIEVLRAKATFDRSSSDSCNAKSSSKSTLNLDPAALNMSETPAN